MVRRLLPIVLLAAAVTVTFRPVLGFSFLNWDDQLVIVDNDALGRPGVARWAFTTMHMEHYQPASWLAWAGVRGDGPPAPARFHAANLVLHALVVLLVWAVARELFAFGPWGRSPRVSRVAVIEIAAVAAALLYGLHPLRVEVVAWVSAMPYALATVFALATVWAWLPQAETGSRSWWLALLLFTASLLARPLALGLPVVLVVVDRWLRGRSLGASVVRTLPFAAIGVAAAAAELVARQSGLADTPWAYRLQAALSAPFVYAWHTVVPVSLTPLDVLPLAPEGNPAAIGAALGGLLLVTACAWRLRQRCPSVLAGWIAYLALLAPAIGVVPSGLQATADRYTYLPGIVLALAVSAAGAQWLSGDGLRRGLAIAGVVVASTASAVASRQALVHWSDSIALWARVVDLDPGNDVGLYNFGAALSAAGQPDAAAERYRAALAVNPAHVEARENLDRLDAVRLEREANALAANGRLAEAATRYQEALARDPRRAHSHAARGMALATLGRTAEAIPHLREALRLGVNDATIPNALAGLLMETGSVREARAVLEGAMTAHPDDLGLAHNLARLLVSLPDLPPPDRMRAFRLAEAVAQATGGQDARALDTLAATLASIGRMTDAREINRRAVAVATAQGDRDLAVQITARGRAYR